MGKKYFFFGNSNSQKDDDMGRRRNKNKHKPKLHETKPRFPLELDEREPIRHEPCGFAAGLHREEDEYPREYPFLESSAPSHSYSPSSSSSYTSSSYQKKQPVQNPENVISTSQGFMEVHHSSAWGSVLIPVEDPKALTLSFDELNAVKLIDGFPKIPSKLWSRWIKLCVHQCHHQEKKQEEAIEIIRQWSSDKKDFEFFRYINGKREVVTDPDIHKSGKYKILGEYSRYHTPYQEQLEVSALLCRKMDNLAEWKILIPKQQVSHASVRAETAQSIDIETGEVYGVFPPHGWLHAGSTHSHNTMGAFFSGTDDSSELSVPGLHIVVGSIKKEEDTYEAKASIVLRQCRRMIDIKEVVDTEDDKDATFHSNVLECISTYSASSIYSTSSSSDSSDDDFGSDSEDSSNISMEKENEEISPKEDEESWWSLFKKRVLSSYRAKKTAEREEPKPSRSDFVSFPGMLELSYPEE